MPPSCWSPPASDRAWRRWWRRAIEERAIGELELHGSLGSLKESIESNWHYEKAPELFCFGLLERFDVKQLAALVRTRPVKFPAPSPRLKRELSGLHDWYALLGGKVDPLVVR